MVVGTGCTIAVARRYWTASAWKVRERFGAVVGGDVLRRGMSVRAKKMRLFRVSSGSRFGVPGFQGASADATVDRHVERPAIPKPARAVHDPRPLRVEAHSLAAVCPRRPSMCGGASAVSRCPSAAQAVCRGSEPTPLPRIRADVSRMCRGYAGRRHVAVCQPTLFPEEPKMLAYPGTEVMTHTGVRATVGRGCVDRMAPENAD